MYWCIYPWLLVWSDSECLKKSSAVVGCASAQPTALHPVAVASASSAYATSEKMFETLLDSKLQPAAQLEQSL